MNGLENIDVGGAVSGVGKSIVVALYWGLIIGIGVLAIIFLIWLINWNKKHRNYVLIKEVVKGRTVIDKDRAKAYKDRAGNIWWKLWWRKDKIPEPPAECVEITRRGKKWCSFYHTVEGGYIPIKDTTDYTKFVKDQSLVDDGFEPFTPEQRSVLVHELVESERYKKRAWAEILQMAIPIGGVLIMVALLLAFWGDVVEPFTVMGDKLAHQTDRLIEYTELVMKLENRVQVIEAGEVLNQSGVVEPPN
jgi:hypothetical protein